MIYHSVYETHRHIRWCFLLFIYLVEVRKEIVYLKLNSNRSCYSVDINIDNENGDTNEDATVYNDDDLMNSTIGEIGK